MGASVRTAFGERDLGFVERELQLLNEMASLGARIAWELETGVALAKSRRLCQYTKCLEDRAGTRARTAAA